MNHRARKLICLLFITCSGLILSACESSSLNNSPSGALQSFISAKKKKDLVAIKKALSRSSLQMIENGARAQNLTLDEVLIKDEGVPVDSAPELRNEKIEGDKGSIEVKNSATGEWHRFPFVKEEGVWKFALDEYMNDLMQKLSEQLRSNPSPQSANSAANK